MQHQQRSVLKYGIRVSFLIAGLCTTAMSAGCDTSDGRRSTSTGPGLSIPTGPGPSGPAGASGPTGSYTLTLAASPTCAAEADGGAGQPGSFPDFLQVRHYDAAFANGAAIITSTDDPHNQVMVGGTNSYLSRKPLMTMSDGELTILVPPDDGLDFNGVPSCDVDGYVWYEAMSTGVAFILCGTWRGSTSDPARIEGTIAGTFEYQSIRPEPSQHLRCRATDHHFALTAKGQSSTR